MLFSSIIDTIGKTPLVKFQRLGSHLPCELYGKCEFLNPGGSVKDRIAARMIEQAEKSGRIRPGDTLIEPTSGNTGIGMALAGAVKGYHVIITMPEKMSREKQVILEAFGAKIIRTPTEAAWDSPESHIGVAKRLQSELPNAHILDQYANPDNPLAHYHGTAQEILDDLDGNVDMVVIGAGTGGTITGIAKRIKEAKPDCIIVGVDPVGSILAGDAPVGTYKVEGIGYDFIPEVLERDLVDVWVKTEDRESFMLARRIISEEGLLVGGSSGAALFGALQQAGRLKKGSNCVVLLPDGVRNYMTKFVDDNWMRDNRFMSTSVLGGSVGNLMTTKSEPLTSLEQNGQCKDAIKLMQEKSFSQIPITSEGVLCGMLYEKDLLSHLLSGQGDSLDEELNKFMSRQFATVTRETPLATLQDLLLRSGSAVVIDDRRIPLQIITYIDLVQWIGDHSHSGVGSA